MTRRSTGMQGAWSRREFMAASAVLAVACGVQAAAPDAVAPRGARPAPIPSHRRALAAQGSATLASVEREVVISAQIPRVCRWRCAAAGSVLDLLPDGRVRLHQPGWGLRTFAFADFAHGQPQEVIRRQFGETVVDELIRTMACWPGPPCDTPRDYPAV